MKTETYKGVKLPSTLKACRKLIKGYIDEVELLRAQVARPGEPAITEEPMLRVPKVEGEG